MILRALAMSAYVVKTGASSLGVMVWNLSNSAAFLWLSILSIFFMIDFLKVRSRAYGSECTYLSFKELSRLITLNLIYK